jgi:hypothetical protein
MIPIRNAGALVLATVAGATTSCTQVTGDNPAYVIVDPQRSDDFLKFMGRLSRDSELTPHVGETTYSAGTVLQVIEASGWGLTLWLANVPLSGKEDPFRLEQPGECGGGAA